jgi:RNA-directed DNA polymerase
VVARHLGAKAVEVNTESRWVLLYVRRWLEAPVQLPDGAIRQRDRGTPQGSAVSPVLANLFLHCAFEVTEALFSGYTGLVPTGTFSNAR